MLSSPPNSCGSETLDAFIPPGDDKHLEQCGGIFVKDIFVRSFKLIVCHCKSFVNYPPLMSRTRVEYSFIKVLKENVIDGVYALRCSLIALHELLDGQLIAISKAESLCQYLLMFKQ